MGATMPALLLEKEGEPARPGEIPVPDAPAGDEVLVRMQAVALNHIDLFGQRGMAFVGRIHIGRLAGEFGGAGIDAFVHRAYI